MVKVNAIGDACPIPVVKTKNAIRELGGAGTVETLVDNEIAVQNLTKMANQKGYGVKSEKLSNDEYKVTMTIGDNAELPETEENESCLVTPKAVKNTVVAVSSDKMGEGGEELGRTLLKSFIYALGQQEELPKTMLFYNSGAKVTCSEGAVLDDLKSLEARGVEILTCGTCLNFYGITDKLRVGEVTNMYSIVEKMMRAALIVKP